MMSANCSVVVTLSRVSRPWRTQCCSTTCLISTCFNRPCPKRVGMPMHADASSFKQAVMVYPSPLKNSQAHKSSHAQTVAESNSLSPLLNAVGFYVRDQPATHAPPSINKPSVVDLRFSSRYAHDPSHQPTTSVNCSRGRINSRCMSCVP